MQAQKVDNGNCGACLAMSILMVFAGFICRDILRWINAAVLFFQRPDALARLIEFFQALGICLGVALLLLVLLIIIPPGWIEFLTGGYGQDGEDDYYN
jgi:uncharacterized membrane protein (DUF441 family)